MPQARRSGIAADGDIAASRCRATIVMMRVTAMRMSTGSIPIGTLVLG
jgi:hypothetical protein